jgi:hypothetical protein
MLKDVVAQVRAVPAPPEVMARFVERAAGWANPEAAAPAGVVGRSGLLGRIRRWAWAAAAALVLLAVGVGTRDRWLTRPQPVVSEPVAEAPAPAPAPQLRGATAKPSAPSANKNSVEEGPPLAAGATALGGNARGAGASPSRHLAVAADATVLVSTGGKKPIPLGDHQPYSSESTLHVWDWSKGKESRPLDAVNPAGMAVSPDGKWIVTGDGRVIDAATGASRQLDNLTDKFHNLQFAPDGKGLLVLYLPGNNYPRVGKGTTVSLLDFPSGKKRFDIEDQWPFTFACSFTPDSRQLCLMDKDRILRRWDAQTGKELGHYEPAFENSIRAIAVSPDSKRLAGAGTRGDIYLWELNGGKLLHKLTATQMPDLTVLTGLDSLAFSPDGQQIAGGSFMRLVLWETDSGKVARVFPNGSGGGHQVRFSKDGKQITTVTEFFGTRGNAGGNLLIYPQVRHWDVTTGKEIK